MQTKVDAIINSNIIDPAQATNARYSILLSLSSSTLRSLRSSIEDCLFIDVNQNAPLMPTMTCSLTLLMTLTSVMMSPMKTMKIGRPMDAITVPRTDKEVTEGETERLKKKKMLGDVRLLSIGSNSRQFHLQAKLSYV